MDRRRLLGTAAAAGTTAWLIACGDDDDGPSTSATQAPSGTGAAGQATQAAGTQAPAAQIQKGGVYRTTSAQVYDSVDVHRAFGDPTSRVANQTQSKLVWYKDPNTGELEPDLAEKIEAPDAATYTFNLRKGIKFHNVPPVNGREFVADDVRWHIERQASNKGKDGQAIDFRFNAFWKTVTKLETPDKYTVKLTLNAPNGTFQDRLAAFFSTIPNREATEKYEADHRTLHEEAMVGTGPFILKEFRAGKDVKMIRNPDYFKGQSNLDGQVWTILFEDPNAARSAYIQKQLDGWAAPDPSVTKQVIDQNRGDAGDPDRRRQHGLALSQPAERVQAGRPPDEGDEHGDRSSTVDPDAPPGTRSGERPGDLDPGRLRHPARRVDQVRGLPYGPRVRETRGPPALDRRRRPRARPARHHDPAHLGRRLRLHGRDHPEDDERQPRRHPVQVHAERLQREHHPEPVQCRVPVLLRLGHGGDVT
jgi:hypothetical protein